MPVIAIVAFRASAAESPMPGQASVMLYGAKCDGNGDNAEADTRAAEIIAASGENMYLPSNNYCIFKRPITLRRVGQRIFGDGPQASKILVYTVFAESDHGGFLRGVLNLEAPGQSIREIGMSFKQPPSPKSRADLISYQPAIMARQPATVISDVLVAGATTCIDMGGNSNAGNSRLANIDTGCFDYGIRLDGSLDTITINNNHSYPFQMTSAQSSIFQRSQNIAIDLGRVDDYAIEGGLCLGETCLNFYQGAQGGAFGTATGYDFDGAAVGISMHGVGAALSGSALTFSSGAVSQRAIEQSAGRLILSGSSFYAQTSAILDHFIGGIQTITGSEWNMGRSQLPAIVAEAAVMSNPPAPNASSPSASRLTLVGNTVERQRGASTAAWVESRGEEILVGSSNSVGPTEDGGYFVKVAHDKLGNRWMGNSSPGWSSIVANKAMPESNSALPGGGRYFGN